MKHPGLSEESLPADEKRILDSVSGQPTGSAIRGGRNSSTERVLCAPYARGTRKSNEIGTEKFRSSCAPESADAIERAQVATPKQIQRKAFSAPNRASAV